MTMLELKGLSRRFGEVVALDGLSFTVGEGQMFGFVGANGAGKTTTMRIVMGVDRPDAREVSWRGRPVGSAARRRFGYMPKERGLYPKMRIRGQLSYFGQLHGMARTEADAAADEWLSRFGLSEEKSSRVVEVLLSAVSPTKLLAGKVLGLGSLGFLQVLLLAIVGVGAVLVTGIRYRPLGLAPLVPRKIVGRRVDGRRVSEGSAVVEPMFGNGW
jgi:hypothetical protein